MRAAEPDAPLTDAEIADLFAPLAGATAIAIAVSGGADSLALLDAVARLRAMSGRPEAIVLTVDHGLRPGSSSESARVVAIAESRELASRILVWEGTKPAGDIEAAARQARYRLLVGAAREFGVSHLLTAHHRDDQAETFLMRLERGSGVFGLGAMRRIIEVDDDLSLFRPFLDVARTRLAATTVAAGLVAVDDPMNTDPRFLRARIRRLMPTLAAVGIDASVLAATAARLGKAADAIDQAVDALVAAAVKVDALAIATLAPGAFLAAPEAVRLRLLARLLVAIGGESYPPRFERLQALHDRLAGDAAPVKLTLAGVVIEKRRGTLVFYRESGRHGLAEVAVGPGRSLVWDHRFRVEAGPGAPAGLTLRGLGEDGRREIGAKITGVPAAALAALPAVAAAGRILAVPSISYWRDGQPAFQISVREIVSRRLAAPPRFLAFEES